MSIRTSARNRAAADPTLLTWLNEWWDLAVRHVPLPAAELTEYRAALLTRFAGERVLSSLLGLPQLV